MSAAYIAAYARTPFAFARKGALAEVRPEKLSAAAIGAVLERASVSGNVVEDVVWGCAMPEGEQGLNIGRIAAFAAGLPVSVPGMTVNRWCGSSMQAVQIAAGMIATGAGDVFVAGGVETMSRVPMYGFDPSPPPDWDEELKTDYLNMGLTAERVASSAGVSRAEQDAFSLASHQKARAAQADGRIAAELAPIAGVEEDGCVRDTSMEALAGLKTVFLENGTVTAGSSSPMTDGAAAVLVCSEAALAEHSITPLAKVVSFAVSGCEPAVMGLGPIESSRKALRRAGLSMSDIAVVEMNEAFAAQAEACRRALEIPPEKLNLDGGAIALGHPLGATGGRLVGKAATLLQREGIEHALATQCIGGGMGIAMIMRAA